jgi:hypothetical protein
MKAEKPARQLPYPALPSERHFTCLDLGRRGTLPHAILGKMGASAHCSIFT